jgi:hypothetical protein
MNPAAIHLDHDYSSRTEFGKPLMNSVFTLGLVVGLTIADTTLGTTVGNLGIEDGEVPEAGLRWRHDPLRDHGTGTSANPSRGRPRASSPSSIAASTSATKSSASAAATR